MLSLMTRTKQCDGIPTERRKRYPLAGLEPRTFCLPGRRTTIIPEGIFTLRFTPVGKHYGRNNRLTNSGIIPKMGTTESPYGSA